MKQTAAPLTRRVRIFDANGLEWEDVCEWDNETGRIVQFVRGDDGLFLLDWSKTAIARREIFTAAPLLIVPIDC